MNVEVYIKHFPLRHDYEQLSYKQEQFTYHPSRSDPDYSCAALTMEAAKAAISKITSRNGHRTEVDEVVVPAVTSEVIKPQRHEETTEAVDREVHQHHYHTTVQPITHKEIAAEKHTHNIVPQVEREFNHGDDTDIKQRVSTELGRFKDSSIVHETKHTKAAAAQVVGEHVHHHVHETVQPVIHKETIKVRRTYICCCYC